jgi:hypothetical protein
VDVNPGRIPWPLSGMRVFTKDKSQELTLVQQADGSYRITRLSGIDVYRIEGTFSSVPKPTTHARKSQLLIHTTASHCVEIIIKDMTGDQLIADIFDVRGRLVQKLTIPRTNGADHACLISKKLTGGVYLVRCRIGQSEVARKTVMAD